jgi:hypothetical protein
MRSSGCKADMSVDTSYLREQANICVRLARVCTDLPTSHQLEEIGSELMARAAELDDLLANLAPPN